MEKIKTIIVDDHSIIRDGIKRILVSDINIKVVADFKNGQELLDFLETTIDVDVILMDISMPVLNGVDTTKIIKTKYKHIKVLALTMHDETTYILSMFNARANGYVLKESGAEELIKAIYTVVEGNNYFTNDVSSKIINSLVNETKNIGKKVLSIREIEIIRLVADGLKNNQIAEKLCLSARTVESHRRNILTRLNLKNTAEMINYAIKEGIVN
ncbi:MAG TPA: response regulator transcription factor [Vicingus sp.]|nr:Transcriptional regulatory protein DegU [Flavobacteriales bacterium]HRN40802.1 response regulator transcription factor [Vicingus sp.]